MKAKLLFLAPLFALELICNLYGQTAPSMHSHPLVHKFPHFRVAGLLGHTFIPAAVSDSKRTVIPSWGLDLEYWWNERFAIGLHNDMEIQSFVIETPRGDILEREYPLVLTLDAIYKIAKGFAFQAGPGYEIEPNEKFFLIRAGVEYEIELSHHWDIAPTIFYDTRFKANDTWTLAIGIGKRF